VESSGTPGPVPLAALLIGRRVRLRPVRLEDYDWLADLSNVPELAFRWRNIPGSVDPQSFGQHLWHNVYCQFVVQALESRERLGLVVAYGADFANQFVYIAMVLDPRAQARSFGIEGSYLFLDYLFYSSAFRKIYGEAVDYNVERYASAFRQILRIEGRLVNHAYVAGSYRDMLIMAVHRTDWERDLVERKARRGRIRKTLAPESSIEVDDEGY
jgi:RimJ/RimL family protein N-acetyltransferase